MCDIPGRLTPAPEGVSVPAVFTPIEGARWCGTPSSGQLPAIETGGPYYIDVVGLLFELSILAAIVMAAVIAKLKHRQKTAGWAIIAGIAYAVLVVVVSLVVAAGVRPG